MEEVKTDKKIPTTVGRVRKMLGGKVGRGAPTESGGRGIKHGELMGEWFADGVWGSGRDLTT